MTSRLRSSVSRSRVAAGTWIRPRDMVLGMDGEVGVWRRASASGERIDSRASRIRSAAFVEGGSEGGAGEGDGERRGMG